MRTDLRDQERAHAGAGAAAKGMRDLEALEAVAALSLLTDNIEHRVDELRALGVVALSPVVACWNSSIVKNVSRTCSKLLPVGIPDVTATGLPELNSVEILRPPVLRYQKILGIEPSHRHPAA